MLVLYYWPGASSVVSHIVLEEIGAPYQRQLVDFAKGDHKSAAYLKINPHGKVPAVAVDGTVITENIAILTYLAKQFPQAQLWPRSLIEEARCISMMAWFGSSVHPNFGRIIRPQRYVDDPAAHDSLKDTARGIFWDKGSRIKLPMHELTAYAAFFERMLDRPAVCKVRRLEENFLKGGNPWDGPYYAQPRQA
jgi:glutathione S-transferase